MTSETDKPFSFATGHHGFRDDKYYLFTKTSVTVMAGWPRILAWQRSAKNPAWRMLRPACGRPSLDDPAPCTGACALSMNGERSQHCRRGEGDCLLAHDPWRKWSALIPREVRERVAVYPKRHWHLLSLAARCGQPAVDLMRSNPALAWALASSWVFREKPVREPMRAARRLLAPGKSQREILAWLGFPATDSARRIFRKIDTRSIRVNTLLTLRHGLQDPHAMLFLKHLPSLDHGTVRLACDPILQHFITPQLLNEVLASGVQADDPKNRGRAEHQYAHTAMKLHDCLRMLDFLDTSWRVLNRIRSRDELDHWHDSLTQRMHSRGAMKRVFLELPPAPLQGTAEIIPLQSERALLEEGDEMKNCVGSYGPMMATGNNAVYRVLAPERATLAISRQGNAWQISELKLARNSEAAPETWKAVSLWLRKANEQERHG